MDNSIYFHEDDYCMIEVLPSDNYDFCCNQAGQATEFSEQHKAENGIGWTDVYMVESAPKQLVEYKISEDQLDKVLSSSFQKCKEIYSGYSSYREICKDTFAYVSGNIRLFYEIENNVVAKIWLNLDVYEEKDKIKAALLLEKIADLGDLIIADWYFHHVVKLKNADSTAKYIHAKFLNYLIFSSQGKSLLTSPIKSSEAIIFLRNSDIINVMREGIKYKTLSGDCQIVFEQCAKQYMNSNNIKEMRKCIGERDICSNPPYIEFSTPYVKTRLLFINTVKGPFKKIRNNSKKQFSDIQRKINEAGFSTLDLS